MRFTSRGNIHIWFEKNDILKIQYITQIESSSTSFFLNLKANSVKYLNISYMNIFMQYIVIGHRKNS